MRIKFHRTEKKEKKLYVSNQAIKAESVYLIDENGENVGVISTHDAIVQAKELDMDLVLVNPKAEPPVAKIVDLGQLKYQHEKKVHKQKMMQKKVDTKNIRLSFRISEHDLNMRLNQAIKFLAKEQKIKVELSLRGRERQHQARAREMMLNFVEKLKNQEDLNIEVEQDLTSQGGRLTIILINKK
jgi:translation initiation factor IF-3